LLQFLAVTGFGETRFQDVLITLSKPYNRVVAGIEAFGGTVKYQFSDIDGLAATIPVEAFEAVRQLAGVTAVEKDEAIAVPATANTDHDRTVTRQRSGRVFSAAVASSQAIEPRPSRDAYVLNFDRSRIDEVHALGFTGRGVVTAVIDSGIRPGFVALGNSVIGGIDLVGDGRGVSNDLNDGHGTFVATLISGKAQVNLSGNPALLNAINAHAPEAIIHGDSIRLIGSAPETKIYAVRVFGDDLNAGSRVSTIIAAIQHVIEKRRSGLNIRVCNLSLGKSTFQAGRDLLDKAVDSLLAAGIVPVVAAGDAGAATLTIASPGSAVSAITVGAANFARNERIMRDVEEGPGVGLLWRPTTGTQTAYFSSRGPNADGRPDPDVIASGFANISQGYNSTTDVSIASGTSFSAPVVSGIAAILRQAFPRATATQIRNAIIMSADSFALSDDSSELDQGRGLVNAKAAFDLLASGGVPDRLTDTLPPTSDVRTNVQNNTTLIVRAGVVNDAIRGLKPGQRHDLLYNIPRNTRLVTINVSPIETSLPPEEQNALFGDDINLFIHTAKTSAFNSGDYAVNTFTAGGSFTVPNPEPGIMRVSLSGDWSNAGTVSTEVTVTSTVEPPPPGITISGSLRASRKVAIPVAIPKSIKTARFQLSWRNDWGHYPTNDMDLILRDPKGNKITTGSTFNSPEFVQINDPAAGIWFVIIDAFDLPTGIDDFKLRVTLSNTAPRN
jgi:subtilisin family serine protease